MSYNISSYFDEHRYTVFLGHKTWSKILGHRVGGVSILEDSDTEFSKSVVTLKRGEGQESCSVLSSCGDHFCIFFFPIYAC